MSFLQAISGFIRIHIEEIDKSRIPQEIIELILLFYKFDLSKYQYLATFNSTQSKQSSYLCAFNLNTDSNQHLHLHPSQANNIFHTGFGSTYTLTTLNNLPSSLRSHLFPNHSAITKTELHIIFKIEGKDNYDALNQNHQNIMKAYLIETDTLIELPEAANSVIFDRCGLLISHEYGLITLGGIRGNSKSDNVQVLQYSEDEAEDADHNHNGNGLKWNNNIIPSMNRARMNLSSGFIDNDTKILVAGGGTNAVEIYDMVNKQWSLCTSMCKSRQSHSQL